MKKIFSEDTNNVKKYMELIIKLYGLVKIIKNKNRESKKTFFYKKNEEIGHTIIFVKKTFLSNREVKIIECYDSNNNFINRDILLHGGEWQETLAFVKAIGIHSI